MSIRTRYLIALVACFLMAIYTLLYMASSVNDPERLPVYKMEPTTTITGKPAFSK